MSSPVRIHCIHTAAVHEATFARHFATAAPDATLVQSVRPDWLAHGRTHGLDATLSKDVSEALASAATTADAVLLTCSTLGPIVDAAHPRVVRVDKPLMRQAARHDGTVILAMCLESTRAATVALFERACAEAGRTPTHRVVLCSEAWPSFEAGDSPRFAGSIADSIRQTFASEGRPSCIVLAQASMAVAEPALTNTGIPVYSSPRLAVAETLRIATKHRQETRACA